MKIEYINRKQFGDFTLGMTIKDLDRVLRSKFREKKSIFFFNRTRRLYQDEGLIFDIIDGKAIEAIESNRSNSIFLDGRELFKLTKNEVRKLLMRLDPSTAEKDGFTSRKLGISLFFEEAKSMASSIIVFQEGYYDRKPDYDPSNEKKAEISIDDLYKLL
jgi:hypothetical protein